VAVVLAIIVLNAENVRAQDSSKKQLDTKIKAAVGFVVNRAPAPFSRGRNLGLFALAVALRKQTAVFVMAAEDVRVDKQVGGGDSNAGSTSLVSKGSIPSILGYAVENGALTREVSGTTITFRGNPVGIVKALSKAGFIESYQNADAGTQFLRRFSFAMSFDTSRGQPSNASGSAVFTGDRQQLSSYSLRFDLVNHRDPRDKTYDEAWHQLIAKDVTALNEAIRLLDDALDKDDAFIAWHAAATAKVQAASTGGASEQDVEKLIRSELDNLASLPFSAEVDSLAEAFAKSYKAFLLARGNILEVVSKGPIVTFEYTNIRSIDAVDLSNFKLIAEGAFFRLLDDPKQDTDRSQAGQSTRC
jgi:hypothetical protein